jgi:hypothetical protein
MRKNDGKLTCTVIIYNNIMSTQIIRVLMLWSLLLFPIKSSADPTEGTLSAINIRYGVNVEQNDGKLSLRIRFLNKERQPYYVRSSEMPGYAPLGMRLFFNAESGGFPADEKNWMGEIIGNGDVDTTGYITLAPGQEVANEINLTSKYPKLISVLKNSNVSLFFSFQFDIYKYNYFQAALEKRKMKNDSPMTQPRIGGMILIPKSCLEK